MACFELIALSLYFLNLYILDATFVEGRIMTSQWWPHRNYCLQSFTLNGKRIFQGMTGSDWDHHKAFERVKRKQVMMKAENPNSAQWETFRPLWECRIKEATSQEVQAASRTLEDKEQMDSSVSLQQEDLTLMTLSADSEIYLAWEL